MKKFKASVEYVCSAKVSFKSFTIVPMEFLIGSALLCFPLAYCIVQISILNVLDSLRRLDLQMWCWIFSLWLSMMSPINNVLLCFGRASFFVQVSVMKMFKSSIEYSLQNSVSIHSLLFQWKSPISAALLCFSLASYNVQVSILKLFEFRKTTLANVMLNFFSVVVNDVSYKQCAALLWSCFLFCSSLSHENV